MLVDEFLDPFVPRFAFRVSLDLRAPDSASAFGRIPWSGPASAATPDELHAVWFGAGLATQVGLVLLEGPERFVRAAAV